MDFAKKHGHDSKFNHPRGIPKKNIQLKESEAAYTCYSVRIPQVSVQPV